MGRVVARERRALELERYVCWVLEHAVVGNSPAVELFLGEGKEMFRESLDKLEKVAVQEEQEYGGGLLSDNLDSLKGIFQKGYKIFEGWMGGSPPGGSPEAQLGMARLEEMRGEASKKEEALGKIETRLRQAAAEAEALVRRGSRLSALLCRKGLGNFDSTIDSVNILSSKTASSSNYR